MTNRNRTSRSRRNARIRNRRRTDLQFHRENMAAMIRYRIELNDATLFYNGIDAFLARFEAWLTSYCNVHDDRANRVWERLLFQVLPIEELHWFNDNIFGQGFRWRQAREIIRENFRD